MSSSRLLCGVLFVTACSAGSVEPGEVTVSRFDDAVVTARVHPDGAIEADLSQPGGDEVAALDVDPSGATSLWLDGIAEDEPIEIFDPTPSGVSVALYVQWKARAA